MSRRRSLRLILVGLASALATGAASMPATATATGTATTTGTATAAANPARIIARKSIDARVLELTIATPAFSAPTHVDVDLPVGYAAQPRRRWPVTLYLAGTNHVYSDFNTEYAGERLTRAFPSIIVAPNGDSGYWSDWFNGGAFGPPMYETFVIDQLIPLIDASFRTIASGSERAVMGESMGGYGTMMFAARHPDLFTAASSLSGAVDTDYAPQIGVTSGSSVIQGGAPDAIYGPRATEEVRWRGHNPTDLAVNLRDVALQIRAAQGAYNPTNSMFGSGPGCDIEAGVYTESGDLHAALDALHIPNLYHVYPNGCHDIGLFEQEITDSIPGFQRAFSRPRKPPARFDYEAIEPVFTVWGWRVQADPGRALEFLRMARVSRHGLTLTGSGTTRLTTPALFRGIPAVKVRIGSSTRLVRPDRAGRLAFTVPLGPPDTQQEYTPGANPAGRTVAVTFTPQRPVSRVTRLG